MAQWTYSKRILMINIKLKNQLGGGKAEEEAGIAPTLMTLLKDKVMQAILLIKIKGCPQ